MSQGCKTLLSTHLTHLIQSRRVYNHTPGGEVYSGDYTEDRERVLWSVKPYHCEEAYVIIPKTYVIAWKIQNQTTSKPERKKRKTKKWKNKKENMVTFQTHKIDQGLVLKIVNFDPLGRSRMFRATEPRFTNTMK